MMAEPNDIQQRLTQYHLGDGSPVERQELEALLAADPRLALASERLAECMAALDAYDPEPPADLAYRVLAQVRAADRAVAVEALKVGEADVVSTGRGFSLFSIRDLIAVAASIAIVVGMLVPVYVQLAERRLRERCQANLGLIALSVAAYAADNGGQLPFSGVDPGTSWLSGGPSSAPHESNTKHWFLLVSHNYADPGAFVCPASKNGQPLAKRDAAGVEDFPSAAAVQYSFHNMAGPRPAVSQMGRMPIAADLSPYFVNGRFRLDLDWPRNASVHGDNAGQVVAKVDGSAEWNVTPNCGINGDNIYQAGTLTAYVGTERPVAPTDTFAINF